MWEKIPREYRKRFNIIVYAYLPAYLIAGLVIGIKILQFISSDFDLKGMIFVSFCLVPLYAIALFSVYRTFQKKKPKHEITIDQLGRLG